MKKYRLAALTSHPIQYQAPLFKLLAKQPEIDLTVYFCWDFGAEKENLDAEFGKKIKWDIPLLEGYKYKFLKNFSLKPSSEFWGQINPGIIKELIWGTSDVLDIDVVNIRTSDVQKLKYDAILIFGWNSFTNWLVFFTAFLTKTPIFLRGENPLNQELLKSKWKIRIKKIILGWLFKHISAFLCIGEENKKFYQFYGAPEEKLFFAPYAVDNERFQKAAQELKPRRDELRQGLGIKKDDVAILFVGKLIEKKRPLDLLKAFSILKTSDVSNIDGNVRASDVHLLYVGDGVLRPELEHYSKKHNIKNVHFLGFKNQTELPEYYAMADVFVLPSGMGETWGLVVNEAMCFGLPVIISDIVGCGPDLMKRDKNGYVFPFGDIKNLTFYLRELIMDKQKRQKFGEASLDIIKDYNYGSDIEGILNAIKNNA